MGIMRPATFADTFMSHIRSPNASEGIAAAKMLDLRNPSRSDLLNHFKNEPVLPGRIPAYINVYRTKMHPEAWAEVAIGHTKALLALGWTDRALAGPDAEDRNDYEAATSGQHDALTALLKWLLNSPDPTGWALPILYNLCRDLKTIAWEADRIRKRNGLKPMRLEESSRLLQKCFSACLNDRTGDPSTSRKMGTYGLASLLFRTYFRLKSTALCKNVIKGIGAAELRPLSDYPQSHQTTYLYYLGVFAFLREEYVEAEQRFLQALQKCHKQATRNIELILDYLVPIRIARGVFPSAKLLSKQSRIRAVYGTFVTACKTGNVALYDQQLKHALRRLSQRQTYPVMEKAREVAVRGLLKRAWVLAGKPNLMPIESFRTTFVAGSGQPLDSEEAECLLANMIANGLIRGYISHEQQKVVLSKVLPFPWYKPASDLSAEDLAARTAREKAVREKMPVVMQH